jgi:hypothetical protein
VPSFCRHNRFVQNCPICREPEAPKARAKSTASRPRAASGATRSSTAKRSNGGASAMRVRRLTRAADDGYSSSLVPGLRATADAEQLAEEIGFATGRLAELAAAPPGLYADAASAPDRDEGIWLAAQIVLLGPAEDADDPFAALREVVGPWNADGTPLDLDGFAFGPRSPFGDAAQANRSLASLRAWAQRLGGPSAALTGDAGWSPERRFERVFERLGTVAGLGRARYDLLVVTGRLGLADLDAPALLATDNDDTTVAAKRVFGIGDRLLLDRRAQELAAEAEVPVAALDLALANLDRPAGRPRMTIGAGADAADPDAWARAAAALGVDG